MTEVEREREESVVEWGWHSEGGSWFQRHGEAYWKERSVIRREDDVGGWARVTSDEERVLWGGWMVMRWCRYAGLVQVVRTLWKVVASSRIVRCELHMSRPLLFFGRPVDQLYDVYRSRWYCSTFMESNSPETSNFGAWIGVVKEDAQNKLSRYRNYDNDSN